MADNKAVVVIGLGISALGIWLLTRKVEAEPPPEFPPEFPPEPPYEAGLVSLSLPEFVEASGGTAETVSEFWPEATLYLPEPNLHYYWKLWLRDIKWAYLPPGEEHERYDLMDWNFLPPIATTIGYVYGYRALDEPNGMYTISGTWGWTPYPYKAVVIPARAPTVPGIYQVLASLRSSRVFNITQTSFEISAPQELCMKQVVAQLTVI